MNDLDNSTECDECGCDFPADATSHVGPYHDESCSLYDGTTITNAEAVEIANAWHSVMTWNDPGVAMYSVSSTGKIHSEDHRAKLLAYVATCIAGAAVRNKERGTDDPPVIARFASDVAELRAFRAWVIAYVIPAGKGTPS